MRKTFLSVCILSVAIISAQDKSIDSAGIKTKDIEQVMIKSQHKKQYADKAVYTFDQEALKKARYAKDLLKTLPELQLDPVSNTIISTKGGATLFLINGIEATDMQIRSIQPAEVLKVEYYDNPPARWATRADILVNILTRNPETGLVFGTDLTSALNTGFINGSAYAGYTKGKNDFGLEYSINLRDYHKRNVESIYDYTLNNSHYRSEENRKEHFGYTDQHIALRYTRSLPDHYTFQAKLEAQLLSNFAKGNGYSTFLKDSSPEDHAMFKNTSSGYTAPTIDLYFSKKLNKKNELSVNLVGSHYTTESSELAREWVIASGNSVYDNDMRLDARQTGIVGELAHVYEFGKGRLSSGYRISNTSISNDLENLAGFSEYSVNYLEQYFYTEYSGKKDKLSYRLGAGLTNIHNKSAENTFDEWTFTPKVILSYQFTNNQTLRFTSSYRPQSPGSSALSSNIVQMAPNIVQRGNPYLKASQRFGNNLIYSYNNKYFDFNTNLFYWYNNRAVNQYYVMDGTFGGYALTYENARNAQQYGIQLSGSYKPFGNSLLVIKASLTPTAETVKTGSGILIRNSYLGNNIVISSEYQSFSIQYMLNIPVYSLDGAFLKTNENQNHVFANYKQKNWTLTAGMYWIGTPSDYKTKSLPESLVNYSRHNQIWDNKSMLVLGISYDFSKGKKNEINRNLNNSTAPAATF